MSLLITYYSRIKNWDGLPSHWFALVPFFFSLISLFQRVLGMPQERLLPNAVVQLNCIVLQTYIYIFFYNIYIYICFQTLQCQSVEWYSTTGTTQLFQPAARPHGQELQISFLAIRLQEWLVTGCYWLILAVVDPVGKLFGLLF